MRGTVPFTVRGGGCGGKSGFPIRGGIKVDEGRMVLGGFPLGGEEESVWHLELSHKLW